MKKKVYNKQTGENIKPGHIYRRVFRTSLITARVNKSTIMNFKTHLRCHIYQQST